MTGPNVCPVCLDLHSSNPVIVTGHGGSRVECKTCGTFKCSEEAWEDFLDPKSIPGAKFTAVQRARISYRLRSAGPSGASKWPKIDSDFVERFVADGSPGPTPAQQAANLVRFVGDQVSISGEKIDDLPGNLFAIIGSPNPDSAGGLAIELINRGILVGRETRGIGSVSPESHRYVHNLFQRSGGFQPPSPGKCEAK